MPGRPLRRSRRPTGAANEDPHLSSVVSASKPAYAIHVGQVLAATPVVEIAGQMSPDDERLILIYLTDKGRIFLELIENTIYGNLAD